MNDTTMTMKTALLGIFAGMLLTIAGCAEAGADADTDAEAANITTLTFDVQGMHCEGCTMTVRNAIAKIGGVQSCEVSLDDESAVVSVDRADASQEIVDAVTELDYTITPVVN